MKRPYALLLTALLLLLCGCSDTLQTEKTNASPENAELQDMVPVAFFETACANMAEVDKLQAVGSQIYYAESTWNAEEEKPESQVFRWDVSQDGSKQQLAEFHDAVLVHFLADQEGNIYYLFIDDLNGRETLFLSKKDSSGEEIYCNSLENIEITNQWRWIYGGTVDTDGRICFYSEDRSIFLFDKQGFYVLNREATEWNKGPSQNIRMDGIVNAGETGCYLYLIWGDKVLFRPLDMTNGKLGEEVQAEFDNSQSIPPALFSGYEQGILLAEENALWCLQPKKGEKTKLLDLQDENVNIMGSQAEEAGFAEDGTPFLLLYDSMQGVNDQVHIRFLPAEEVPVKQKVVVGVSDMQADSMERAVKKFNRRSQEYTVVLQKYGEENSTISDSLLLYQGILNGNAPDIISMSELSAEDLTRQGVLEDLKPYFQASSVVKQEDILPAVWEAGMHFGKMTVAVPEFQLNTLFISEDLYKEDTWTLDELMELAEAYPDRAVISGRSPQMLMDDLLVGDMEQFINWEDKKASFETDEFMELLKFCAKYKAAKVPDSEEEYFSQVASGEVMLGNRYILNMS